MSIHCLPLQTTVRVSECGTESLILDGLFWVVASTTKWELACGGRYLTTQTMHGNATGKNSRQSLDSETWREASSWITPLKTNIGDLFCKGVNNISVHFTVSYISFQTHFSKFSEVLHITWFYINLLFNENLPLQVWNNQVESRKIWRKISCGST